MISFAKILTLPLVMLAINCNNCYSMESQDDIDSNRYVNINEVDEDEYNAYINANIAKNKRSENKVEHIDEIEIQGIQKPENIIDKMDNINIIGSSKKYDDLQKELIDDILKNIIKIKDKDILHELRYVLAKLPEAGKTEDILKNIIKINDKDILDNLYCVLRDLPDEGKTEDILENIVNINDKYVLSNLYCILLDLPDAGKTEDILKNIINIINDKDVLNNLKHELINATNDEEKMKILYECGVLHEENDNEFDDEDGNYA